jgi:hypothetical protein
LKRIRSFPRPPRYRGSSTPPRRRRGMLVGIVRSTALSLSYIQSVSTKAETKTKSNSPGSGLYHHMSVPGVVIPPFPRSYETSCVRQVVERRRSQTKGRHVRGTSSVRDVRVCALRAYIDIDCNELKACTSYVRMLRKVPQILIPSGRISARLHPGKAGTARVHTAGRAKSAATCIQVEAATRD